MRRNLRNLIALTVLLWLMICAIKITFDSAQEEHEQQNDDPVYMENYYKDHKTGEDNDTIKMRNTKRP